MKKFIKTMDGSYICADKIAVLTIGRYKVYRAKDSGFAVNAQIDGCSFELVQFACDPKSTTQFNPKAAAQAWLDNFVKELNKENCDDFVARRFR